MPLRAKQLTPSLVARSSAPRSGSTAATSSAETELDVDVAGAELVPLDGQARRRHTERREDSSLVVDRLPGRDRLLHPPEDDARAVALQLDGDDAGDRLQVDDDLLQWQTEDERRAEHRMSSERQLGHRREDADPDVRVRGLGGSTNTDSENFISRASDCMSSLVRSRASVKTASWLPVSGVSVKTSATT